MRCLELLFYLTVLTGFIGPILAPPSNPSLLVFKTVYFLYSGALVAYLLIKRKAPVPIYTRGILSFFCFWLVWGAASFLWLDNLKDGWRQFSFLLGMSSSMFFFLFQLQGEKQLKRMGQIFLFILAGFITIGLIETLTDQHLSTSVVNTYTQAYKIGMPSAVFWNPNDFATYLSLFMPFALGLVRFGRGVLPKIVGCLLYGAGFYLIIVTESRANVLAVFLGLLVFFKLCYSQKQQKKNRLVFIMFSFILLTLVCLIYFQPELPFVIRTKRVFDQIFQIPRQFGENRGSVYVRVHLILYGLQELRNHYFLGVGVGNAEAHLAPYAANLGGVLNLHNWWVEVLVNYGVIVFWSYLLFYLGLLKEMVGVLRWGSPNLKGIAEPLLISLVSFSVACIGPSSLIHQRYLWFLFAFAVAVLNYARSSKSSSGDQEGENRAESVDPIPSLSQSGQSDSGDFRGSAG
jgi:teichuronic acid biosynthesis protein TuaE